MNTAKHLAEQPILALNPDPQRVGGILIPFSVEEAASGWRAAAAAQPDVT